ncbi:uncharacterized protein BDZ99DRAFT_462477 [Mytilinidion resinicola]|uniref:Uncharacterized protein n=1 Tax=Mytilinidion resinicola TaxID=574789 RepID=A0A6A6YR14_9PEZI|nr:uncharacterized protein BDZ99DRAFT_462477 [Mytilinidion resinicola]KAF2811220.1 hypothetical protein BDZ99DRAFT_462477 [Mytilinidion resinicola]
MGSQTPAVHNSCGAADPRDNERARYSCTSAIPPGILLPRRLGTVAIDEGQALSCSTQHRRVGLPPPRTLRCNEPSSVRSDSCGARVLPEPKPVGRSVACSCRYVVPPPTNPVFIVDESGGGSAPAARRQRDGGDLFSTLWKYSLSILLQGLH